MSTSLIFPTVESYAVPDVIGIDDGDEDEDEEVNFRYVDRKGNAVKTFAV